MVLFSNVYKTIASGLSRNTEALLVFGLVVLALGLFVTGMNQYLACLFPLSMYILYRQRAEKKDKHNAEMERLNVERVEATRMTRLERAWNKTLQVQAKTRKAAKPAGKDEI